MREIKTTGSLPYVCVCVYTFDAHKYKYAFTVYISHSVLYVSGIFKATLHICSTTTIRIFSNGITVANTVENSSVKILAYSGTGYISNDM